MARATQQLDQLVADDLDDLLSRRQRREHILANGLDPNALDEALHDFEIDVRFEKRHAHLAQRLLDILLRQPAKSAEPVEDACEARGEAVEHGLTPERAFKKH